MSTPERPSLADTIARIDAALAERAPGSGPTLAEINAARDGFNLPPLPPELGGYVSRCRCVITSGEPVTRDGNTFTVNTPGVYELTWNPGGSGEPSVAERGPGASGEFVDEFADVYPSTNHLPGAPGPTCPGCAADAARPGWLARALHRLFG